jgi:hypothetical protein
MLRAPSWSGTTAVASPNSSGTTTQKINVTP